MIRVYSDLNCPFCFVLHERLITLPVRALFHWRLIEHAPNLVSESNTRDEQEQLARETDLARQRAQTISLTKPDFCVNSRLAMLSYLAVEAAHPTFAPAYLTALPRVLAAAGYLSLRGAGRAAARAGAGVARS